MCSSWQLTLLLTGVLCHSPSLAFITSSNGASQFADRWRLSTFQPRSCQLAAIPRYGPPADVDLPDEAPVDSVAPKNKLRDLIGRVGSVADPEHIPSVLTKEMEFVLSLTTNVIQEVVDETAEKDGPEAARQVAEVLDVIVTFAEEFVAQASQMEDQNRKLLGKIIRTIADKDTTLSQREQTLDRLLRAEKDNFTAGFLRHVDNECTRIANAPKMTPDSVRLMEIMRIIQARVLEELGADLGEAAQVLGQLIGYKTKAERLAVLEAGLQVRGVDFAKEMKDLTEEALEGFTKVIEGADPGLVQCITEVDDRLRVFLGEETEFQ